jgi:hypothetical protein
MERDFGAREKIRQSVCDVPETIESAFARTNRFEQGATSNAAD